MKNERDSAAAIADISLIRAGIGAAAGLLVTILTALALSAFISAGKIDPSLAKLCAFGAVALGGIAAGFLSSGKRKMLVSAAITALIVIAALGLLGALIFPGMFSMKICVFVLIILLISCILGSVGSSFIR